VLLIDVLKGLGGASQERSAARIFVDLERLPISDCRLKKATRRGSYFLQIGNWQSEIGNVLISPGPATLPDLFGK